MNITKAQYARIEKCFPVQRGNVKIDNYTFINAILYIAENGCKWRALPEKYGKWNSIYQRFKRWCENGVIQRIFNALQQEKIIAIKVEVLALDSTSCKLRPDAHGALKNTDNNVSGNQRADGTVRKVSGKLKCHLRRSEIFFAAKTATFRKRKQNISKTKRRPKGVQN